MHPDLLRLLGPTMTSNNTFWRIHLVTLADPFIWTERFFSRCDGVLFRSDMIFILYFGSNILFRTVIYEVYHFAHVDVRYAQQEIFQATIVRLPLALARKTTAITDLFSIHAREGPHD